MRRPNFILSVLGMLILALGISICSVAYWLVSNIIVIVVGMGVFFLLVIFLASTYSYVKDTKMIRQNFDGEEADALILSLRKKVFVSAKKIFILMLIYGVSWGIIIWFLHTWLM